MKRINKYNNKKCEYNGILFDSKKEMQRYVFLLDQEKKGVINDLKRQIKYTLVPNIYEENKKKPKVLQRAITYTADFEYTITETQKKVVEDVKASKFMLPKDYILKKKLLFYVFKIQLNEVFIPTKQIEI